jgi:transcriptional regulatory protein RtcR
MPELKTVVIGLLGTNLDAGVREQRWERWRPSVDLCRHEDLAIDRFELIAEPTQAQLAATVAHDIVKMSPETQVRHHELHFNDPWDFEEVYASVFAWTRAYPFAPEHEQYLVHITTGTHVVQICWFLLTESRHVPGKLIQASPPPARDRSEPGSYRVIDLDLSRYDRIARRFEQEKQDSISFLKAGIDTKSSTFNLLIEQVEVVATRSSEPILLTGPTGAGKSQLARRVFELKRERQRLRGPFVEVNCATLRGDGAMSALFGHVKGAYTGAVSERAGLLRTAHAGVLFLDEIGELGADEQAMLLRAIEDKSFLPVGSDRALDSDFQLIAGTNRDLSAGSFRDDLLARVNLWTFELPGLSARPEDMEPNLDYELDKWEKKRGRRVTINREARALFLTFARSKEGLWLGNFRDFNAAITRMATLAPGGRIDVPTVHDELGRLRKLWQVAAGERDGLDALLNARELAQIDLFDRVQLTAVIEVCRASESLSDAGRKLFAASRARKQNPNDADRLRKYLSRFGLSWQRVSGADARTPEN